jgi:hypothetical protein
MLGPYFAFKFLFPIIPSIPVYSSPRLPPKEESYSPLFAFLHVLSWRGLKK